MEFITPTHDRPQCLPVAATPPTSGDELEKPAATAADYLRRVRQEVKSIPDVVVAKIDPTKLQQQTHYLPEVSKSAESQPDLLADPEWETKFASDFSDLRQSLRRYCALKNSQQNHKISEDNLNHHLNLSHLPVGCPSSRDKTAWRKFCLGRYKRRKIDGKRNEEEERADSEKEEEKEKEEEFGHLPTLQIISNLDEVTTATILTAIINDIVENTFRRQSALWLFCLFVRLEKPISANLSWKLRELYRRCAALRVKLEDAQSVELAQINIIMTIIHRTFSQMADS